LKSTFQDYSPDNGFLTADGVTDGLNRDDVRDDDKTRVISMMSNLLKTIDYTTNGSSSQIAKID
jgi:hypothetical protein